MRYLILILFCWLGAATPLLAQKKVKGHKLSKDEMARMTPEQRLVHETQRKGGKDQRVSSKRKARIQKQQSRKAARIKTPKK
jgi:hypothetical protein